MKTILFLAFSLLIQINSQAQKTLIGFTAGVTSSNFKFSNNSISGNADRATSFTAGMQLDFPIGKDWNIETGLNYLQKGTLVNDDNITLPTSSSIKVNYVEVPLNLLYAVPAKKGNFIIGSGISTAFGISGKNKIKDNNGTEESTVKFGSTQDDDIRRFDFGVNLIAGYHFKNGCLVSAIYNFGLKNLLPEMTESENVKLRSNYFGLKIGYLFAAN